jgi:hypothetical protein
MATVDGVGPRIDPTTPDYMPLDPIHRREFMPVDMRVDATPPPQTNSYAQLGEALKGINPQIQQYLQNTNTQNNEIDAATAKTDAIRTGATYGEAVRRGLIDPNQSPYYMQAWKELDGQNAADSIAASVQSKYETDPIRNSTDPQAIHDWTQQQIQAGTAGMDSQTMLGAGPKLQALAGSLMAQQGKQAAANAQNGLQTAYGTQVSNITNSYMQEVQQSGQAFSPSELASRINAATSLPQFAGVDPKTLNSIQTEAVIAAAKTAGDDRPLQALSMDRPDRLNPGQTIPGAGMSMEGKAAVFAAGKEILAQKWMAQDHAHEQETWQDTQNKKQGAIAMGLTLASGVAPTPAQMTAFVKSGGDPAMVQNYQLGAAKVQENNDAARMPGFISSLTVPQPDGQTRLQAYVDAVGAGKAPAMTSQESTALAEKLNDLDSIGPEKDHNIKLIMSGFDTVGANELPMFKDGDAKTAVKAMFLSQALPLLKGLPQGQDSDTIMPQLMQARDNVINVWGKLHPATMNLSGPADGAGGLKALKDPNWTPPPTPQGGSASTSPSPTPAPRADATPGSPFSSAGYATPDAAAIQAIKYHNHFNPGEIDSVVRTFIQRFGRPAYNRALSTPYSPQAGDTSWLDLLTH